MVYHVLTVQGKSVNYGVILRDWDVVVGMNIPSSVYYDCLVFSPLLSLAPILRIFLYYTTRKDRAVETISLTRRRGVKNQTLFAIILSFLSKVAYYLPVKIITCKMLLENMKILFSQPNIWHLNSIIFTSGKVKWSRSVVSDSLWPHGL